MQHIKRFCKLFLPETIKFLIKEIVLLSKINRINVPKKILTQKYKGIAFIFFMGLGDALFVMPIIKKCKSLWPDLKLQAYVSSNSDINNSPLVAELLKLNPHIDKIYMYDGRYNTSMLDYDYSNADIPADYLKIPLKWIYGVPTVYRVAHLFRQYYIPFSDKDIELDFCCSKYSLQEVTVRKYFKRKSTSKIVIMHMETRSSKFKYNDICALIDIFCSNNYGVLLFSSEYTHNHESVFTLNTKLISISDTFSILKSLSKEWGGNIYGVCVQSFFWPLTSIFKIPVLGINIFYDANITSYYTSNLFVLTTFHYSGIFFSKYNIKLQHTKNLTSESIFYSFQQNIDKQVVGEK